MDYTTLFLMICACTFMYRIAEAEKRRGWLWVAITLLWTLLIGKIIDSAILMFLVSLLASYFSMFLVNIFADNKKHNW